MPQGPLPIWTIYEQPEDFPNCFVARLWLGEEATAEIMVCPDLEPIREALRQKGLVVIPRDDDDDPVIVESWL
jgi:hypothetical protein